MRKLRRATHQSPWQAMLRSLLFLLSPWITLFHQQFSIVLQRYIRCTCMIIITSKTFSTAFNCTRSNEDTLTNTHTQTQKALNELQYRNDGYFFHVLIALLHVMLYHFCDCLFKHFLFLKRKVFSSLCVSMYTNPWIWMHDWRAHCHQITSFFPLF